jgi:hypothetical protein
MIWKEDEFWNENCFLVLLIKRANEESPRKEGWKGEGGTSSFPQLEIKLKTMKCLTSILASENLTHALYRWLFLSWYFGSEGDIDPL